MLDSYGREIKYLRLSVTDLCNLRCRYCMGEEGVCKKKHSDILSVEELAKIAEVFARLGVTKVRITGGEPLVRKGIVSLAQALGGIFKNVGITTNGILLPEYADALVGAGVNAVNVSIDTLDEEKYYYLTRGGRLDDAIKGLDRAIESGFEKIKINAVLLKDANEDEIYDLAKFASKKGAQLRLIELMPFDCSMDYAREKFLSASEIIKKYSLKEQNYVGGNCRIYRFPSGEEVGIIAPVSGKFCASCDRVRVTADGKLLNCLHENREYDLKAALRGGGDLEAFILDCVKLKPKEHGLYEKSAQVRPMNGIGG